MYSDLNMSLYASGTASQFSSQSFGLWVNGSVNSADFCHLSIIVYQLLKQIDVRPNVSDKLRYDRSIAKSCHMKSRRYDWPCCIRMWYACKWCMISRMCVWRTLARSWLHVCTSMLRDSDQLSHVNSYYDKVRYNPRITRENMTPSRDKWNYML